MSFAKVTIVGNLGRDPESRYLQSGTLVVSFTMAANGRYRSNQEQTTTWFRVSAFGEQAERLVKLIERGYIAKGRTLYVEGQLEERKYTGNDGQQRTSLEVSMTDWQFVGGNQQDRSGGGDSYGSGNRGDFSQQDSGSSYGGSNYGNEFPGSDEPGDLNEVPF